MDCERWFNELTHKYLEYVRVYHLKALNLPIKGILDVTYWQILQGDMSEAKLTDFSKLLATANDQL